MDPLTAIANAVAASAQLAVAILNATPDAEKAEMAKWAVADIRAVRKFFHMDV